MRLPALPRAVLLSFVLVVSICAAVSPARAESILGSVRVDPTPAGGVLVTVGFGGSAPVYHLVGVGTAETAVIFDNTSVGAVPPTVSGSGPMTSLSVSQTGGSSNIALHLTGATPVRVRAAGATIFIDVSKASGAVGSGSGAISNAQLGALLAPTPAPQTGATVTELISLKYADISEIAGVLAAGSNVPSNDTFSPTQTNIGTSSLTGSFGGLSGGFGGGYNNAAATQAYGGAFGQQNGLAQRVNENIAVDRRLNAIILTGTPDVVASLRAVIDKLDIPVRSVILETQIVELSDSAARNIGIDISPDGSGVIANASGSNGGYTIKNLQPGIGQVNLQAVLFAQVSLGNAKIIAKPRILAQSGQPASILTGDAIPIITSVVFANSGAGAAQQVSYVNVGVNLQIQPRVSSDGFVTSHIYSEVSSVTNFVSGVPQISQRTANTIASVRDGESFVIGGLLQDNEIRNLVKLPFIGDLPLIGTFFRHVNTSHSQTNLYIVVTPHIVASGMAPSPMPTSAPAKN
jgi:general secretion pathway protein D